MFCGFWHFLCESRDFGCGSLKTMFGGGGRTAVKHLLEAAKNKKQNEKP